MITFGEVIKFKEAEYVYLAATDEIVYLAKILNREEGNKINQLYLKRLGGGAMTNIKVADHAIYCFVMLTTTEFKDRMTHLAKPPLGHDFGSQFMFDRIGQLNTNDLKEIKQTIMTTGHVPIELKELVENIEI